MGGPSQTLWSPNSMTFLAPIGWESALSLNLVLEWLDQENRAGTILCQFFGWAARSW